MPRTHADRIEATLFNVQHFCLHDGPGIRTTVFLKGCGLRCLWCCNPESQEPYAQLGLDARRCTGCAECVAACPEQAITMNAEGKAQIDRDRCTNCGKCVSACLDDALTLYGETRSVDDVFREVLRDKRWYGADGGVTVSGGEPLTQARFVRTLLEMCRVEGIGTCIETCGAVPTQVVADVLPLLDFVLFDLKHLDDLEHYRLTHRSNRTILENAKLVAKSGVPVQFRTPLIPGLNDSEANLRATAQFLSEHLGERASIELMPYHRLAAGKYTALGYPYQLEGLPAAAPECVRSAQHTLEESGVPCIVSV
jgi:pyruvate formate lyase activating enzyme